MRHGGLAAGEKELKVGVSKTSVTGAALAVALLAGGAAEAKVYNFTFTDGVDSGAGQFVTATSNATSNVIGVSGQVDGQAITGLSGYAAADNVLYAAAKPYVDFAGISISTAADSFNLFSQPAQSLLKASVDPVGYAWNSTPMTLNLTAVPEPGVWMLMLTGVFGLGVHLRSQRRAASSEIPTA